MNRNSSERYIYEGLAAKLSSTAFVKNLGLMMDTLEELKDLSEALQTLDRLNQISDKKPARCFQYHE